MLELQHQYRLPILNVKYHGSDYLVSADRKLMKIWTQGGELFCPFEPPNELNDFEVLSGSGLILTASEAPKMGVYFVPALGPPPQWCSFLETLTEELEEEGRASSSHPDY